VSIDRGDQLEPAYVLHRRPYRDSSLILEVFVCGGSRIALVARGARRASSRWQSLLQLFQPILLSWGGRGELGTLRRAEAIDAPPALRGQALLSAMYVNELLLRLLHRNDPHPGLFDAYQMALQELTSLPVPMSEGGVAVGGLERALRLFELRLLREIGYGPMLDKEAYTLAPIETAALYHYVPETGPVLSTDARPMQGRGVMVHGGSLQSLDRGELNDAVTLRECKRLMREILDVCLGGRPLNSRRLFRARHTAHAHSTVAAATGNGL